MFMYRIACFVASFGVIACNSVDAVRSSWWLAPGCFATRS